MLLKQTKIAVIGLGYVGLPLAVEFAKKFPVVGFDINTARVNELKNGVDKTLEVENENLQSVLFQNIDNKEKKGIFITNRIEDISHCNFYIITVPTPTDKYNRPVLTPLIKASETVGSVLKAGDIIVYESTVYPGATEEECIPVLENKSGKKLNKDFYVGYSPERINPGDKKHTVTKIRKVTSGSTLEIGKFIDDVYKEVIEAGTFLASSIKVAEASKVIENSQRDINIAFVNELSKIFKLLDIDTNEVLEAAATKWNFLPFKPGLVGGHCIGVDPFYLAQKAQEVGYHPEIILAGRRMNDSMGAYVAKETIKLMINNDITVKNSNILILGITFKENCPDIRNSRVIDIINELKAYKLNIDVYDPWANAEEVKEEYNISLTKDIKAPNKKYDAIIAAVAHNQFLEIDLKTIKAEKSIIFDVKSFLPKEIVDGRL
ncbi:MAG: nucleotide sugar dehydrogenase [Bacteroidales bacterium]|nr:nucleotide sugar dehydrogenase [Bacteroidales bacterium]